VGQSGSRYQSSLNLLQPKRRSFDWPYLLEFLEKAFERDYNYF
jgi:hypothetical protein